MILIFAGTSDARELALGIQAADLPVLTSVVTDNAAIEMNKVNLPVRTGRLTSEEVVSLIKSKNIQAVVDASHPFAEEASKNAQAGAKVAGVPYIRYERQSQSFEYDRLSLVDTYEEAAEIASTKQGVIMLTTGSKTLQVFTDKLLDLDQIRLVARMLPRKDNMEKCEMLGFPQKDIIAIQGPFSKELNKALYKQYEVKTMITKESGKQGSVDEKVEAAIEMGIEIIMISRPKIDYGTVYSNFTSVIDELKKRGELTNGF